MYVNHEHVTRKLVFCISTNIASFEWRPSSSHQGFSFTFATWRKLYFCRDFLALVRQLWWQRHITSISIPTTTNLRYYVKRKRDEPHLVFVSAKSFCVSQSTMSSAFCCDLRRKDGLFILFTQVCSRLLFEDLFILSKGYDSLTVRSWQLITNLLLHHSWICWPFLFNR